MTVDIAHYEQDPEPEFDTKTDVKPVEVDQSGLADPEPDDTGANLLEETAEEQTADILPPE